MIKDVVTARKENTVQECMEILFKKNVGSAVIVDEDQKCIGIFTERDAIRVVAQNIPLNTPLEKVMSKNIYTVSEDTSLHEARATMRLNKIRHLPVVDSKGRLVGLISIRNLYDEFFEDAKRFVNS
jgi:CBS domain-containing protein